MSGQSISEVSAPKQRLLFVEDEATLREHLAERLSDEYLVDTAGNGNDALLAVMRAKPALVVTDIVMPDMDGVELLKTLRQTPGTRSIPVLLISGRAPEAQRIEGFDEGADGFLAKPYTERELRALIGSMLRSAQLRTEAAGRNAREQAEQKAVIEQSRLLESITDAFYTLDKQWRFTYVNQRALDFYDKKRVELLGRAFWDVFPMARRSVLEEQYQRALREQCPVSFETISPSEGRWVEVRACPTPQGLVVNFRDIDARKQIEGKLQYALAELHAREEQLRESQRQVSHLEHLVDDLLDISGITHGSVELRREKILLTEVLASAVESSRPDIDARAHKLLIDVRPTVPVIIEGDRQRLAQIFSNLLANSAKYTDREGTITLTLDCQGSEAVVSVRDTGIGIPPHGARSERGPGIGLALVRALTQLHGGSVSASSQGPGTGSVFTVRLPVVQKTLDASTSGPDAVSRASSSMP